MNRDKETLTCEVPVALEFALSRNWSESFQAVFEVEGRLIHCDIEIP